MGTQLITLSTRGDVHCFETGNGNDRSFAKAHVISKKESKEKTFITQPMLPPVDIKYMFAGALINNIYSLECVYLPILF